MLPLTHLLHPPTPLITQPHLLRLPLLPLLCLLLRLLLRLLRRLLLPRGDLLRLRDLRALLRGDLLRFLLPRLRLRLRRRDLLGDLSFAEAPS